jgi:hypothetical protein
MQNLPVSLRWDVLYSSLEASWLSLIVGIACLYLSIALIIAFIYYISSCYGSNTFGQVWLQMRSPHPQTFFMVFGQIFSGPSLSESIDVDRFDQSSGCLALSAFTSSMCLFLSAFVFSLAVKKVFYITSSFHLLQAFRLKRFPCLIFSSWFRARRCGSPSTSCRTFGTASRSSSSALLTRAVPRLTTLLSRRVGWWSATPARASRFSARW